MEELKKEARYNVGDMVWTSRNGPWTVTGRYWSRLRGCITYDITFNYNGVELLKLDEAELFRERQ